MDVDTILQGGGLILAGGAVGKIADAARGGKVDPAKVADEIDRILGRKK